SRTSNHPLLGARPTAMVMRANLQMFISTGCIYIIDGYIKAIHKQKVNWLLTKFTIFYEPLIILGVNR
ncbi:hypothetical protein, partial [uncultured Nostoc sp.]|uniref:hypothetical protein n=1 Tax=uncultured Nostoc sp. TaxID=340711 RepID=UPI00261B8524